MPTPPPTAPTGAPADVAPRSGGAARWSRLPRSLHPVAWWVWAVGVAAAASLTTNPLLLLLLAAAVTQVVLLRRGSGPWARSFRLYLALAGAVVVLRLLYRVVFGGQDGGTVLLALPEVPLPHWFTGLRLLGDVTSDAVVAALQDGLRLGTVVLCVGAANSLADPRRLLAALPPALYELGTALVIAVTVFAQLADSVRRVQRARRLRAPAAGVRRPRRQLVRSVVVPVLTDALDRSLALAAAMDARGYGRAGTGSPARRALTAGTALLALALLALGAYATLAAALPGAGGPLVLLAGVLVAGVGLWLAGRDVRRTRYRPDRMRPAEWLTVVCGVLTFLLVWQTARGADAAAVVPSLREWPPLTLLLVAAAVVAALPAVLTPRPEVAS
ncbi:energy-coupling factor transporter transmembrane protein EcfT [Desertihabitans brevis]|uniref:Energy-coupling factor transporter transmembrane protein EcfT n=1 Tax=Desertihabitans brevis TaxID=2268447 RepID=A0A367YVK9_9ACTN|nr:CbiQ family ECF transporter T component [Desertihabitans brevis]RCK69787.1 energy-coupling factor transporter transmembrane protein EcfT [Desertihabitans brevis]